ncbi:MAG: hypothetical protein AB8I08_01430 [Sandaracinaceae bacterium]
MSTRALSILACFSLLTACAAGDGGRDGGSGDGGGCTTDMDCTDDGVFCNGPTVCQAGVCVPGMPPSCEDGVACTEDSCSAMTDECQNVPNDTLCPATTVCQVGMGCVTPSACEFDTDCGGDGMFCNGDEVCVDSVCTSPEMRGCDDENSCTIDDCSEGADSCSNVAADHLTDVMYCGATGDNDCVVCAPPTAEQVNMATVCASGECLLTCDDGFFDSDSNPANGCECASGSAEDEPDVDYLDTNCDGIDGDRSRGILVSAMAGNDTATCGLELTSPCRTIAHAMTRSIEESRRDLFLMAGTYDEVVTLRDGVRIFGGYDTGWVRGPRSDSDHRTEITGGFSESEGQYVTIIAHDLVVAPTLENLVIIGPDAEMDGMSSYAVHVEDTDGLTVLRCAIVQGHGANGAMGDAGMDAAVVTATPGMQGGMGGIAGSGPILNCDDVTSGVGGAAGVNSCTGGLDPNAGAGGPGGVMDNTCFCPILVCVCSDEECDATGGVAGNSATQMMSGGFGFRGAAGATCSRGGDAMGGQVLNGAPGAGAAASNGSIVDGYWVGTVGGTGGTGDNGGGGGGGGGSGGCDDGFIPGDNSWGAGGGGGGAGGCAAFGGGGGGGAGGGSFGVFAVDSTVTASNCEFARGNGGVGGTGGVGGRGQSGGPAGAGGTASSTSTEVGGAGADGAHGGHGGGGGGGAGGHSYGVFSIGSTVDSSSSSFTGGSAGAAGTGGPSAPSAPAGEQDGNDGLPGVAGARGDVFECSTAGSC